MSDKYRTERDSMGEMQVPESALYGAQTARAVENFPISALRFQRSFIHALGLIKSAAARVNGQHGWIPVEIAAAIERAADEIAGGQHDASFVVDVFQTGSGTSTNMNANEVIGHLAHAHPNDDVNRGQSSNDVIPTAMHVAAAECVKGQLFPAMQRLQGEANSVSPPDQRLAAASNADVLVIGHVVERIRQVGGRRLVGALCQHPRHLGKQCRIERHRLDAALGTGRFAKAWHTGQAGGRGQFQKMPTLEHLCCHLR